MQGNRPPPCKETFLRKVFRMRFFSLLEGLDYQMTPFSRGAFTEIACPPSPCAVQPVTPCLLNQFISQSSGTSCSTSQQIKTLCMSQLTASAVVFQCKGHCCWYGIAAIDLDRARPCKRRLHGLQPRLIYKLSAPSMTTFVCFAAGK